MLDITLICVATALALYAFAMRQVRVAAFADRLDTVSTRQCGSCGRFASPGVQACATCGAETLPIKA